MSRHCHYLGDKQEVLRQPPNKLQAPINPFAMLVTLSYHILELHKWVDIISLNKISCEMSSICKPDVFVIVAASLFLINVEDAIDALLTLIIIALLWLFF